MYMYITTLSARQHRAPSSLPQFLTSSANILLTREIWSRGGMMSEIMLVPLLCVCVCACRCDGHSFGRSTRSIDGRIDQSTPPPSSLLPKRDVTYPLACCRDLMSFFTFHVSTARFPSAVCPCWPPPPPPDDMAACGLLWVGPVDLQGAEWVCVVPCSGHRRHQAVRPSDRSVVLREIAAEPSTLSAE
jgi:hypothetical protein